MAVYIFVLTGVGQVAFTKKYFNEADSMVGEFLAVREKYGVTNTNDEATSALINTLIEESANSSNDLQELASQSFNIILGALLAVLSASATVIFDALPRKLGRPHSDISPEPSGVESN